MRPYYVDGIVIKAHGVEIGEIYPTENGWGSLCYASDNGVEMIDSKKEAIQEVKEDYATWLRETKEEIEYLAHQLKKYGPK